MLLTYLVTIVCLMVVLFFYTMTLYFSMCSYGSLYKKDSFAFFDPDQPDVGICSEVLMGYFSLESEDVAEITALYYAKDIVILIPVLFFMLLD